MRRISKMLIACLTVSFILTACSGVKVKDKETEEIIVPDTVNTVFLIMTIHLAHNMI